ncbi:neuroligin-4, Y-linked-like [Daphnia pulex]|uniref:neuroligin-4, Y-linked-like n=1 Tax=Daphnia pulex TaxID=6669 RepID=UPI001EDE83DD|nr:neuroligin-4, Y-linked-like [Daphnia pulex]XP_046449418.1 neuroligin-4, Y-linked-like [Daphnia pulex]
MHNVTMKPVRINDNGAFSATKLLLLFICASITLQCFSVGMLGSVSAASIPWTSAGPGRVVRTKHGNLRGLTLPGGAAQPQPTTASPGGHRKSVGGSNNKNVEAFLGIPYAAPPVGSLRFLPPASPGPWTGIRSANALSPACPQQLPPLANRTASLETMPRARYYQLKRMQLLLANQSEDCLYLNVYAPSEGFAGGGSTSLASSPVMVLVHGESYSWGAGHLMDGAMLAGKSRMVVVTLNYRLGILGFLQTAASPTPGQVRGKSKSAIPTQGNYGLLDIVAAVLWLKDNIGVFGGDSSRITLSGHGTGAALVNLLMISPIAAGLFQRVVLMSGSALSPWALNHQAGKLKAEVARQMDCEPFAGSDGAASAEQMSLADIGDCLRKKPLESLMAVRLPAPPRFFASFAPFVDGAGIVAIDPLRAMQSASEDFARIPLVAGVTSIESYRYTGDADLRNGISEDKRDRSLRTLIRNFYQYHLNEIFYVLRNEYTDWDRPSALDDLSMRDSLSLALSDALVVAPLMHVVHLHAQRSTNPSGTFFYHFQGQMLASVIQQQVQDVDLSEYHRLGSVTGDELEALQLDATANGASWSSADGNNHEAASSAGYTVINVTETTREPTTSGTQLLPFLASFASTGDPNLEIGSKGELMPRSKLRWEPFNLHSQYYMVFGKQQHAHLKTHYRGHQIAVWLQLIPSLHQTSGDGTGTHPSIHHTFDQHNTPADQFYEGVVRLSGNNITRTIGRSRDSPLTSDADPVATSATVVECSSSVNGHKRSGHNQTLNGTSPGTGDWTIVNPSVMASETGSSSSTVPSPGNNNNSTSVSSVAGGESRLVLGFFWTNQATLSIILVLGNILLIVNLILFVTIYRRSRCGNCKRNGDDNDVDTENTIQRISDGQLEGRVARQSIESMTDLRQLVISHCHQHPRNHPDITSQALGQQHPPPPPQQPLFASGVVSSDLTTSTRLPSPQPFLLRVPSPHHQFLLDESNKSATLPGNRRAGGRDPPDSSATYQQASAKSIQEINV